MPKADRIGGPNKNYRGSDELPRIAFGGRGSIFDLLGPEPILEINLLLLHACLATVARSWSVALAVTSGESLLWLARATYLAWQKTHQRSRQGQTGHNLVAVGRVGALGRMRPCQSRINWIKVSQRLSPGKARSRCR